ncbi:MAG: TolC family protein [Myxococcales bacterium]
MKNSTSRTYHRMPGARTAARVALAVALVAQAPSLALGAEPVARASQLLPDSQALRTWLHGHQLQIAVLKAKNREAVAATRDARLLPNPVLTLGVAGIALGNRNPRGLSWTDTQNYQATLTETIELGKRSHRIRSADLHAQSTELESIQGEGALVADAREGLARLVYLNERKRVLEERLQSARAIVALDQVRLDRGDVSGIDHNRLLLDVANVERELADNANELASAQTDCAVALGSACEPDVSADQLEALLPPIAVGIAERFDPAVRPDIRSLHAEAAAQQEQAQLFANRAIPDPVVGVSYVHDNLTAAGNQPHTLGVSVSIPLPVSDRGQHQRAEALARAEQAEAQAHVTERAVTEQVRSLARTEQITFEKLTKLKNQAFPLAVGVLDATERAYRLGQVSMTDLLLARRQRGELALDLVDTRFALFGIRSQMLRALGVDAAGVERQ